MVDLLLALALGTNRDVPQDRGFSHVTPCSTFSSQTPTIASFYIYVEIFFITVQRRRLKALFSRFRINTKDPVLARSLLVLQPVTSRRISKSRFFVARRDSHNEILDSL